MPTVTEELRVTAAKTYDGPLLRVKDLVKRFPITSGIVFQRTIGYIHAVEGVSFELDTGETLGLVGESGCGKSTTGRCILQLYKPTSGSVIFEGQELTELNRSELQGVRREMLIPSPTRFAAKASQALAA